jgi:adenylate cyclase
VQRNGTKIRINAQLADATTNAQLWSESFEGDQSDLFALQDRVTTLVGNSIGREMVIVAARESESRKSSPKVSDLMLRASALNLKPQSLKNLQQEEDLYRQALAQEPSNAGVMADLAAVLVIQAGNFGDQMDASVVEKKFSEGRDLVLKAKELDPDNPRVYNTLGSYAFDHGDLPGARRAYETLLSLEPKKPIAYFQLARVYLNEGEPKRTIELLNQATSLDPRHVHEFNLLTLGWAYFDLGDNDAAIASLLKSVEKNPRFAGTYMALALAYALKGEDAKAREAAAEFRRLDPSETLSSLRKDWASNPAKYQAIFETRFVPAWRKAGLPE